MITFFGHVFPLVPPCLIWPDCTNGCPKPKFSLICVVALAAAPAPAAAAAAAAFVFLLLPLLLGCLPLLGHGIRRLLWQLRSCSGLPAAGVGCKGCLEPWVWQVFHKQDLSVQASHV